MNAEYLPPGDWHPNDFRIGDKYVTNDQIFKVTGKNNLHYHDFVLEVKWLSPWCDTWDKRVWPNLQWVALNWEDS